MGATLQAPMNMCVLFGEAKSTTVSVAEQLRGVGNST
jgi:hypothetical protein